MKKIINALFLLAVSAVALTSCSDVPAPYDTPNQNSNNPTTPTIATPIGSGTEADPYNVAAAIKKLKDEPADQNTAPIYVKGVIAEIKKVDTGTYGNADYYIIDKDYPNHKLYIFQSKFLANAKFTAANQIKVGDVVVIYGPFVNYKGTTPETVGKGATYIYKLNEQGGGTVTPPTPSTPVNTEATAYTVTYAINLITNNQIPTNEVYVKGIICKAPTYNATYKSLTYYISDDGTTANELQIFSGKSFNGADFTAANELQVGQTVVVLGHLKAYTKNGRTTNEIDKENKLVSVNGGTQLIPGSAPTPTPTPTPTPSPSTPTTTTEVTAASLGLANETAIGTQTLSDGTTITTAKGSNNNAPKFYSVGGGTIRMYPGNTISFNAGSKQIASITLFCDEYKGDKYTASGNLGTTSGTVALNGLKYTIIGINAATVTFTNNATGSGAPSQLRIKKFVITYAN